MGFAHSAGDALTFYVLTVPSSSSKRQTIIARSVVTIRMPGRKANGTLPHKSSGYYFPSDTEDSHPSANIQGSTTQDLKGSKGLEYSNIEARP